MRARFEIQQKLRRQKKHEKKRQKEEKQKRSSLRNKRGKQQDKTKTQAMDEYKAKRSAGTVILVFGYNLKIQNFEAEVTAV